MLGPAEEPAAGHPDRHAASDSALHRGERLLPHRPLTNPDLHLCCCSRGEPFKKNYTFLLPPTVSMNTIIILYI